MRGHVRHVVPAEAGLDPVEMRQRPSSAGDTSAGNVGGGRGGALYTFIAANALTDCR